MRTKDLNTCLTHAGEAAMAKQVAASVSVPKVLPIYMNSVFSFDDVESLDAVYAGEKEGYVYHLWFDKDVLSDEMEDQITDQVMSSFETVSKTQSSFVDSLKEVIPEAVVLQELRHLNSA